MSTDTGPSERLVAHVEAHRLGLEALANTDHPYAGMAVDLLAYADAGEDNR